MKASKFEEIISGAVAKVKPVLSSAEAQAFDQMLSIHPSYAAALPKRIKEFNAEPYLFIFEAMLRRRELVEPALAALAVHPPSRRQCSRKTTSRGRCTTGWQAPSVPS